MNISITELEVLTKEYGGEWGFNHTKRLLKLISDIAEDSEYNKEAVIISAYLHDWGGYKNWLEKDVDHAVRSKQVAEQFLKERDCEASLMKLVLECIEYHHSADFDNSIEAKLLCDADALDFLGAVGVLRDFSKKPGDLRGGYETTRNRRSKLPQRLLLDKSRKIAEGRIRQMDELLAEFEAETFGMF